MFSRLTSFLLVFNLALSVQADDELNGDKVWLIDFAKTKFVSASAIIDVQYENQWNKQVHSEILLNFETAEYRFIYDLTHSENWDILTKDGTINAPEIIPYHSDSKIQPWSNFKGMGTYSEHFERVLPNWQVFDKLAPILEILGTHQYMAPLNGVFYDDEIKILKKFYNRNDLASADLWKQLEYNDKGYAVGVSADYLTKNDFSSSNANVSLLNDKGQTLKFEAIEISIDEIVSGVKLSMDGHELVVFSRSLNKMLFKFAPELFPDPELVFTNFLLNLQDSAGKDLDRFSNNMAINE